KSYQASDKLTLTCTVTNEGDREGAEVVQVYIGKRKSEVPRALKELKGFQKVLLEKGASKQVSIQLDIESLSYYDEKTSTWALEKGDYEVYVGNASNNISKRIKIKVE
ncbi:MAG: fibronectin type III-like domain-contianing protein, partial [Bacteroidota bacterium]